MEIRFESLDDFISKCNPDLPWPPTTYFGNGDTIIIEPENISISGAAFSPPLTDSSISFENRAKALALASQAGLNTADPITLKKLFSAVHREKVEKFCKRFPVVGVLHCPKKGSSETTKNLDELFKERFKGRSPGILRVVASVCDTYKLKPEDVVHDFDFRFIQDAMRNGLSPAEAILIGGLMSGRARNEAAHSPHIRRSLELIDMGIQKNDDKALNAGMWMAYHPETSDRVIRKVEKRYDNIDIEWDTPVAAVEARLSAARSSSEMDKVEKAYKKCGFKFADCTFDLLFSEAEKGKYRAYIMRPGDTRMASIGKDTHCCQVLGDAGESAMMHGLVNPRAGFFVIEETNTERIVAQAEIWETEDPIHDTLVFDNMEFANDADIELYYPILKEWLENSPYETVVMGMGYNEIREDLPSAPPAIPWVTPEEVYIISHEEESEAPIFDSVEEAAQALADGKVTYFDYVYCDSERQAVYLKDHGRVQINTMEDNQKSTNKENSEEYDEPEEPELDM